VEYSELHRLPPDFKIIIEGEGGKSHHHHFVDVIPMELTPAPPPIIPQAIGKRLVIFFLVWKEVGENMLGVILKTFTQGRRRICSRDLSSQMALVLGSRASNSFLARL